MAVNPFHDSTSTVPKSDPKIERIEFDKSDLGARKSHLGMIKHGNPYVIKHVKGS